MTYYYYYEVWAEVQASPGFQEITGMPTIRRLEFSGEDLDAATAAAAGLE